jgi:hypothetical protein
LLQPRFDGLNAAFYESRYPATHQLIRESARYSHH